MVRSVAGRAGLGDPRVQDFDPAPHERFVQRADRHVRRKRPEPRNRRRDLAEAVYRERPVAERVPPVVEVADDQCRQRTGAAEQVVFQQLANLPVPFPLGANPGAN